MSAWVSYGRFTDSVLLDVADERARQVEKHGDHTNPRSILEQLNINHPQALGVLTEEVGEVARAINEGDLSNLEVELIQVAAVASAWVENIRRNR